MIPPLSATGKLPQPTSIIEWARSHARSYQLGKSWSIAADVYEWLYLAAETFQGRIAAQAMAIFLEGWKGLEDDLDLSRKFHERPGPGHASYKLNLLGFLEQGNADILYKLLSMSVGQSCPWSISLLPGGRFDLRCSSMGRERATNLHYSGRYDFSDEPDFSGEPGNKENSDHEVTVNQEQLRHRDVFGWSPLHYATISSNYRLVRALIRSGCDANARDVRGRAPLHIACKAGRSLSTVKALLLGGSEINKQDDDGVTPLQNATAHGNVKMVRELILAGADINAVDSSKRTALHLAAYRGSKELTECLGLAGAKRRDRGGKTALHLVAIGVEGSQADRKDIARYLIEELKANENELDAEGRTPLHLAAKTGNLMLVEYLVEETKADPSIKTRKNETPVHLAASGGFVDVVRYLVEMVGVEGNNVTELGDTPLHCACRFRGPETMRLVTRDGASLDQPTKEPRVDLIDYLIKHMGANVNRLNVAKETPLRLASKSGHTAVVKYLIEEVGTSIHGLEDKLNKELIAAAITGHVETVAYLVKRPAWMSRGSTASTMSTMWAGQRYITRSQEAIRPLSSTLSNRRVSMPTKAATLVGRWHPERPSVGLSVSSNTSLRRRE